MSIQTLTPPQDITWTRLAFSRDMIDTNFGDMKFSPKWRSSLAVYFYIVPEEETADAYPNSRILYLKLTCSITGWNPSEDLLAAKKAAEEAGQLDDMQRTLWEVITSSGWADTYWPCLGAIMQIAIYPNDSNKVTPDDYPYIMDFEPKKRELYEQVTQGGESLSGSSDKLSVTKGSTNTQSVDVSAGSSFFGIGVSASAGAEWQQIDSRTTDTSRESRETLSHTTSFSQMYQLFNGYHIGTNRALFVVAPRPHTEQSEFNLINGERKLEGLQDVFLVVHMSKSLDGFCIQAGLDTGHQATISTPQHIALMKRRDDDGSNYPVPPDTPPPLPPPPQPTDPIKQLVITRRVIQCCGVFDENGNFNQTPLSEPQRPLVVGEVALQDMPTKALFRSATGDNRMTRINVVNNLNMMQSQVNQLMLDRASSVYTEPKNFENTKIFKSLVANSMRNSSITLGQLATKKYVSRKTVQLFAKQKITTLGDLLNNPLVRLDVPNVHTTRMGIIDKLLGEKKK